MIQRFFQLRGHGTDLRTEVIAGITSFLTFLLMSLPFSIATGLAFGFISHVLIKTGQGKLGECDPILLGEAGLSLVSLCL